MKYLLIDIGNHRMKWAWWDGTDMSPPEAAVHGGRLPEEFIAALAGSGSGSKPVNGVMVSSVAAPELNQALRQAVQEMLSCGCQYLVPPAQGFGLVNAYARPETLGADRWAVMLGAMTLGKLPACIVDCGTAVTVDAVDHRGRHLGGVIFAGLRISREALTNNASRLGAAGEGELPVLARDTRTGIRSGTLQALAGAVDHLIDQVAGQLGLQPTVLLTGGDAESIAGTLIRHNPLLMPDLVLRGLAVMVEPD